MKRILLYSLLILSSIRCFAQDAPIRIAPYINATTSIRDGQIEAGPEFNKEDVSKGQTFTLRPFIRVPLTNPSANVLQIDRFSSTWRGVVALQYTKDNTKETGNISRHSMNAQLEYGATRYAYYPTGNTSDEQKSGETSYALEIKYIGFFSKGFSEANQFSPQFRLRYSYDWKASDAVGVVNPPNSNGLVTTTDLIIDAPYVRPTFSPAFSLQIYPGSGSFSYSPTLYYDFTGATNTKNPFNNRNRVRLETWIFFYPLIRDNPNVKIGLSPFLNIRTAGTDSFNKVEYGGLVTIKFGTTFLHFF
jgi:hypothetical protein